MHALALSKGYQATLLLTPQATADAVKTTIADASRILDAEDILLVTYSGHGGQMPDRFGEEPDAMDETWALYDRELVDDELSLLWSELRRGVRVLVLADSCHSGTMARAGFVGGSYAAPRSPLRSGRSSNYGSRAMPRDIQLEVYRQNQTLYDRIQHSYRRGDKLKVNATVVQISGCQDDQLAWDGEPNGLFTATLLKVWDDGKFEGTYRRFYRAIANQMPMWQTPNLLITGLPNRRFIQQTPFNL
jgi:hypothetical protein